MNSVKIFCFGLLLFATACKRDKEVSDGICFTRTLANLVIENNSSKTYYYASYGQNILPLIDWAAFCQNNLLPRQSITIDLNTIPGYLNTDNLVVYYWRCSNNVAREVSPVILSSSQKVCK